MGKGRDKRKKREDPVKAAKRAAKQHQKLHKNTGKGEGGDAAAPEGFNNEESIEVTLKRLQKQDKKIRTVEEVQNVPPPTPRANVVFVAHPERENELLVFGGEFWNGEVTEAYNDLYFYHLKRNTWAKLSTAVKPAPRSSSQGLVYKHFVIVFGGEFVSQTQSQYLHFKDVWRFNSRTSEWEELKTLKGGPSSRSGHRMVQWKRNAVVFGGFYDNAQECRYFDDLWILSQMEGAGHWQPYKVAPGSDLPHARSGHSMSVYQDTLFVYGGYSTEKFNRFKKSEATVHHDLWMIKLVQQDGGAAAYAGTDSGAPALPVWQKIRLGGVPPPIRCGVSSAMKDRRMYLFGGVVDIESPGGKMVSTFNNDLFVFHMDTKRFFPVVLRRKTSKAASSNRKEDLNNLQAQLKALQLGNDGDNGRDADDSGEDDESDLDLEDDDDDTVSGAHANDGTDGGKDSQLMKESFETNRYGQVYPHRRMDAAMIVSGNHLYIFGGQFESGKKEITMSDLFALNLNKLDTYTVLQSQDLSAAVWLGKESEGDANSWESGSTVVSNAFDMDYGMDDDDDDEEGEEDEGGVDFSRMPQQQVLDPADDTDEAPQAIPAELSVDVTPGQGEIDFLTRVRGKKGLQVHKQQLQAQLSASSAVPTPATEETFPVFFARTEAFWETTAKESIEGTASAKRVRKEAAEFARRRYHEAKALLSQLALVEEREREEAKFFHERRLQKEREWEEYEREQEAHRAAEQAEKTAAAAKIAAALKGGANMDDEEDDEDEDSNAPGDGSDTEEGENE